MPPVRIPPGPGQESVWDYPRPPALRPFHGHLEVLLGGERIAEAHRALQVLETSHPPTYYLPLEAFRPGALVASRRTSFCEWKGRAQYWDVLGGGGRREPDAAWGYPEPSPDFAPLRGHVALYAGRMDACRVDGERVVAQPGGFYGGWITARVVGPFKGAPGSGGW